MPKYNINDLIECCNANPSDVVILRQPEEDAKLLFGLSSKTIILEFIGNGGLEYLSFVNTKDWENNYDTSNPLVVDAYEFRSLGKLGYIAFIFNDKTKKWIIKSFHLSMNDPARLMLGTINTNRLRS